MLKMLESDPALYTHQPLKVPPTQTQMISVYSYMTLECMSPQ